MTLSLSGSSGTQPSSQKPLVKTGLEHSQSPSHREDQDRTGEAVMLSHSHLFEWKQPMSLLCFVLSCFGK